MTIILPLSRACSRQSGLRAFSLYRASNGVSRVAITNCPSQQADYNPKRFPQDTLAVLLKRHYADQATSRPAKPKAHTGRAKATKPRTSTAKASTRATKPKKSAAKKSTAKKSTTKRNTAKKPKRTTKAKSKAKSKAKPKPRRKRTEVQKAKAARQKVAAQKKQLQKDALVDAEPKLKPSNGFAILFAEMQKKGQTGAQTSKEASAQYKRLSPQELERYTSQATKNTNENKANREQWLKSLSPEQIRLANLARASLRRVKSKDPNRKKKTAVYAPRPLSDERLVKRNGNAYNQFFKDRYASGDFGGMTVAETGKMLGSEWRNLSDADREIYKNRASGDQARYLTEYKTVYGHNPPQKKPKAAKAATAA